MSRKRPKLEEIVAKLRQADVLIGQGQSVAEAIRAIGVSEVTYYRRRREFGGLKTDRVRRMKDLEVENQRLRKAIADRGLGPLQDHHRHRRHARQRLGRHHPVRRGHQRRAFLRLRHQHLGPGAEAERNRHPRQPRIPQSCRRARGHRDGRRAAPLSPNFNPIE